MKNEDILVEYFGGICSSKPGSDIIKSW